MLHQNKMINITSNYSFDKLKTVNRTNEFLKQTNITTHRQVDFIFEVKQDIRLLNLQGHTFAINFKNHGELNFYKILRCRESDVENRLYESYIYSYLKCFHNGLFYHRLREDSDLGFCYKGHAQFLNILKSSGKSRFKDDFFVSCIIQLDDDDVVRRAKFVLLLQNFPFLKKAKYKNYLSTIGTAPFMIPELEYTFSYLKEDYYSARAQGEPEIVKEKSNPNVDSKGKVLITKCGDKVHKDILMDERYPLTNAFTTANGKELLYIEVNGKYTVKDNPSFFFAKANFLVASNKTNMNELKEEYYRSMSLSKEQDFMVTSEVFSNTGIRCKFMGDGGTNVPLIPSIPWDSLSELIGVNPERFRNYEGILEVIKELQELIKKQKDGDKPSGK